MAVRRLAEQQPDSFAFSEQNQAWAEAQLSKYPPGRQASAVIPILWRAQEQEGWISEPVIRLVAEMLDMAYIRVLEVATFYTMFQLAPVGSTAHIQVCGTTPCMLRGSDDIIAVCKRRIADRPHELSADGRFSWEEVECLGACVNAPMVQMVKDTYEDLTAESFEAMLDVWEQGGQPTPGPQTDRVYAMPAGGATSLTDPGLYDGTIPSKMLFGDFRQDDGARADGETTPPAPARPEKDAAAPAGKSAAAPAPATEASKAPDQGADGTGRPPTLDGPIGGKPDDLKKIKGIGPKIEKLLHENGIFHFSQIEAWGEREKAWVDESLSFKGRIDREDWVGQARQLARGEKPAGNS